MALYGLMNGGCFIRPDTNQFIPPDADNFDFRELAEWLLTNVADPPTAAEQGVIDDHP